MANLGLRASWIATLVAAVLGLGTLAITEGAPSTAGAAEWGSTSIEADRHPFTDRGPRARGRGNGEPARGRDDDRLRDRRRSRGGVTHLLVRVPRSMQVRARPDAGAAIVGTMPSGSKYYGVPITAWIEDTARQGRWGLVEIPYTWPRTDGWIRIDHLITDRTHVEVRVDLSEHRVSVTKFGRWMFGLPAATGAPISPTPPGDYFVTDRIPFSSGGSLGSFAFGISGIQPKLPPGWSGGNQLAIHGTNDTSSIGTSASAGCLRVSERGLDRLLPLLRLGTPVIVRR